MPRSSLVRPYMIFTGADVHPVEYRDTVWDDLRFPATVGKPGSTAPTWGAGTSTGNFEYWKFAAPSGADERLHFSVQMPHDWKLESSIYLHVHWLPDTAGAGDVRWKAERTPVTPINSVVNFAGASSSYGLESVNANQYKHILTPVEVISMTGITGVSAMFDIILYRTSDGPPSDTYAGDALLWELDIHYERDTAGSREMTSK